MIQLQVLNYLLDSKDTSLIILNDLNKKYFSDYVSEWLFIETHFKKYGAIPDKETFAQMFQDFEWLDVKEPASYLISELFKEYQAKQLQYAFNEMKEQLINGNVEKAKDVVSQLQSNLIAGISLNCTDLLHDTSRYDHYIEKTKDIGKYYLTTGFEELDKLMGGFDRNEELGVVIARTNKGKTWVLLKMASAAAEKGLNVGLYSGEMSVDKVGYRADTLLGHVNNGAITHGNISAQVEYKTWIENMTQNYEGHFYVLTPQDVNGPVGVNTLRAFIEKYKLDVLFIDQLPLLKDDRKGRSKEERMSNIIIDLKNLQMLKKMPIISVSQQNREGTEEDIIDTVQIAGSDDIGKYATFVLGIARNKKDESIMEFHITKTRDTNGANTKLCYKVDLNKGNFEYVPSEKDTLTKVENPEAKYETQPKGEGEVF